MWILGLAGLSLLAALAADRRSPRAQERMGALPALALPAAEALTLWEIMASAGVTAAIMKKVMAGFVVEPAVPWSEESQAWKSALKQLHKGATSQGMQIGEGCAWILSPATLMGRLAQCLRDELATHGQRSPHDAILEADSLIRTASKRWSEMVKAMPNLADEAVTLTPEFKSATILSEWTFALQALLEIGQQRPELQGLIDSAVRRLIGEMASCWEKVGPPGFWYNLGQLFKRSVAVPGRGIGKGGQAIAWSVIISLVANEVREWLERTEGEVRPLEQALQRFVVALGEAVREP